MIDGLEEITTCSYCTVGMHKLSNHQSDRGGVMCQICLDRIAYKHPEDWKCELCGVKNTGNGPRGESKCFECWKLQQKEVE